jgi:hypothetical protein
MTKSFVIVLVAVSLAVAGPLASTASARVWADVYLADEVTPLPLADPNVPDVYRDIMVGTRLTIFVSSDIARNWEGKMWLSWEDEQQGIFSARGYSADSRNYEQSCLPAAGNQALVNMNFHDGGITIDLLTSWNATAGELFVLDYEGRAPGICNIGMFAIAARDEDIADIPTLWPGDPPPFQEDLIQVLSFHHVPSRDYDQDRLVNFVDFAMLANRWRVVGVGDPNTVPQIDLNGDDWIDARDIALFSEYWLERTQAHTPAPEPNMAVAVP